MQSSESHGSLEVLYRTHPTVQVLDALAVVEEDQHTSLACEVEEDRRLAWVERKG